MPTAPEASRRLKPFPTEVGGLKPKAGQSKKPSPGVILEQLDRADIAEQHLELLLPRHLLHLGQARPRAGGLGQKPGPQRMRPNRHWIEPGHRGVLLDKPRDRPVGHRQSGHFPMRGKPREQRSRCLTPYREPGLQPRDRQDGLAIGNGDHLPFPFLVGLGRANGDPRALLDQLDIGQLQRDQLSAAIIDDSACTLTRRCVPK